MFFKRIRREFRELRYSVQKLIKKYFELERRIKVLEREKADCETNQPTDTFTEIYMNYLTGEKKTKTYHFEEREENVKRRDKTRT